MQPYVDLNEDLLIGRIARCKGSVVQQLDVARAAPTFQVAPSGRTKSKVWVVEAGNPLAFTQARASEQPTFKEWNIKNPHNSFFRKKNDSFEERSIQDLGSMRVINKLLSLPK